MSSAVLLIALLLSIIGPDPQPNGTHLANIPSVEQTEQLLQRSAYRTGGAKGARVINYTRQIRYQRTVFKTACEAERRQLPCLLRWCRFGTGSHTCLRG